jgi:ATP-dependent DNA helicase 2 subunit 2
VPVDELLGQKTVLPSRPAKRTRPSVANGIPEFKQAIQDSAAIPDVPISDTIAAATKEFGDITRKLIQDSFASTLYEQAEANIRVMRRELIVQDEPDLYNSFIRTLKKSLLSGELNGDRRDMWRDHIVAQRLGLITKEESDVSDVTDNDAQEVRMLLQNLDGSTDTSPVLQVNDIGRMRTLTRGGLG